MRQDKREREREGEKRENCEKLREHLVSKECVKIEPESFVCGCWLFERELVHHTNRLAWCFVGKVKK